MNRRAAFVRDLVPGDICSAEHRRDVVVQLQPRHDEKNCMDVLTVSLGVVPLRVDKHLWMADAQVTVEAPGLTPAQCHAEELLALVATIAEGSPSPQWVEGQAAALLAKIDPPRPVTLEEALARVVRLRHMGSEAGPEDHEFVDDLLQRARRAGQLK